MTHAAIRSDAGLGRRAQFVAAGLGGALLTASQPTIALTDKATLTLADVAFYTFGLTATMLSLAIIIAYRAYKWISYVLFALLLLLTVASMDGTLLALSDGGDFQLWVVPFLTYCITSEIGRAHV